MATDLFKEFGVSPNQDAGSGPDLFAEFGVEPPPKKQDGALIRGVKRATSSARTAFNLATGDAETGARLAGERAAYEQANPGTPAGNELMAAWRRGEGVMGGIEEVAGEVKKDWQQAPTTQEAIKATGENLSAMGGGIVEQIPNMVAPMVGMGAGALAGAPAGPVGVGAGMWAGASAGNTAMESAEKVDQALRAASIDPADKPAVEAYLRENGSTILGQAAIKGGIIGLVDTLTMKLGNKLLLGPAEAATARAIESLGLSLTNKAAIKAAEGQIAARVAADPLYLAAKAGTQGLARNVGAAALEPAGEFAGEFVGEGVSTGDWDTKNAALEALSAVGQGAITFAGQKAYEAATSPLRRSQKPDALAPTNTELDEANAAIDLPAQQYMDLPGSAPLLEGPQDVIEVPTATGTAEIRRTDGALSAAVIDTGVADALASGMPLRSMTKQQANDELANRPDAERLQIIPHPVSGSMGRVAIVERPATELAAIDARAQAAAGNQARDEQLRAEEDTRRTQAQSLKDTATLEKRVVELNRSAASVEATIKDSTPPEDAAVIREQAKDLRTQAKELYDQLSEVKKNAAQPAQMAPQTAQENAAANEAEAAQEELITPPAQPMREMPIINQAFEAAREQAQARTAQVVDEEAGAANLEPTPAQVAAGNYRKGHIKVGSLDIAIENPAGSVRKGIENGKKWATTMGAHYGYLKRTEGADGDQVDVYVKQGTASNHNGPVFVIDQFNPRTGQFDEHKAMIGFVSKAEAQSAYDAHFSDKSGPKRRRAITEMTPAAFKTWAKEGDTTQPIVEEKGPQDEIRESTGARFARKRGESQEDYQRRMADEKNAKKAAARSQFVATDTAAADIKEATGSDGVIVPVGSLPGASDATADQLSRQAAEFMTKVAKLFGKRLVVVEDMANGDGFYLRGNNIFVSTNSTVAHLRVLGHEMLHALKNQAPKAYASMLKAVQTIATDAQLRGQVRDYFADKANWTDAEVDTWLAEAGNRDLITEEWMADLSGNRWAESSFWESVFSKISDQHGSATAKGIIAQLRMAITNALNKLLAAIKGDAFSVDLRVAEHLDQIREAVAQGFADYAKTVKDNQAVDHEPGQAKFSKPGSDIGHKRTSKGEYVGAPAGMTPSKLGALRTRLRALAKEGEPGRFWYEESSDLILAAAEGDKAMAEKIAGLLAIYSPQSTVSANTSMGLKALYQWVNGDPIKARFGAQDKKAQAWMDGTIDEKDALQIKTGNFFRNLMRKIDEDRYGFEKQGATIDMWMARVFGYGSKAIGSEARYFFAERETKRLAEELGWEPQQVQAALWVSIKSRIEAIADDAREIAKTKGWLERKVTKQGNKENVSWPPLAKYREDYEGLILKMALAQSPDPSGLLKAAYHFGTALKERTGQISWEAMPGKTTGVLPGIFQAPLEQQAEYLVAMDRALRDENGQDLIAKKLGLPVIGTAMGPSAWQMAVGVGAQTEVAIATERDQGNKKVSVSAPARNLLNTYSAIRGLVLNQEAVVWHFPIFTSAKKDANGIQLDFGRDPTHDEVVSLYNAIHDLSGREDWAPAYVPGVGLRILNFSDVPHVEFHAQVKKAAATLPGDLTIHFETFQSDGDYIANDWQEKPDGEDYRSRISGSGQPNLQGWVESELRPRAERVNQEFAEKYGWGSAKLSTKRSDAAGDGRDGSGDARASEEVRGYGTAAPGAVTVQGTHYSQQERTSLDGRYYGTGMRGAEGPRVRASADPRLKERVYFYVDKGTGLRPEDGVGAIAHTAQLNNVYDANADTWVQAKVGRSVAGDAWLNAFEAAVIDNGFDGYVTDFGTQRAAVLLGRHNVPVTRGQGTVSAAKQAAPTPVTDRVATDRRLPSGRMTGAEWKQLIPEATMLEDGKGYYKDDVVGQLRQAKLSTKRLAPNGKPSNLTDKQYDQVRTPAFKAWFGDWEHAAANGGVWNNEDVSKVVDENGEPAVVYHGSTKSGFTVFEPDRNPRGTPATFFSDNARISSSYSGRRAPEANLEAADEDGEFDPERGIYSVFLNIRNPLEADFEGGNWDGSTNDLYEVLEEGGDNIYAEDGRRLMSLDEAQALADQTEGAEVNSVEWLGESTNSVVDDARVFKNDGAIIRNVVDNGPEADVWEASNVFAAFSPEQVKSAVGNTGAFDAANPDIRYSQKRFYSQLERQIEAAPDKVFGSAKQVSNWLVANAGKLGIKQDEIQWSGITDWLALQQKVGKADVLRYLVQNSVQVEEVLKGEQGYDEDNPQLPAGSGLSVEYSENPRFKYEVIDRRGRVAGYGDTEAEAIADAYSVDPSPWESDAATKYHNYALPGGENYRELLLTLPNPASNDRFRAIQDRLDNATTQEERVAAIEERTRLMEKRNEGFSSDHWKEKNILAHVRFNDRTDADGNKVLFIEELQSDWAQVGKRTGFKGDVPAVQSLPEGWSFKDVDGRVYLLSPRGREEGARRTAPGEDATTTAVKIYNALYSEDVRESKQPKGPFVTDTKSWLSLGLKRMIAYAVENGYDKVAFINGQQSADRYDLSKQVDKVEVFRLYDGLYNVEAYKDGKALAIPGTRAITPAAMEGVIGKELTKRAVEDIGLKPFGLSDDAYQVSYSGVQLQVGGEGMKAFYDKIVPQTISDVLKRVGGGKLETVTFGDGAVTITSVEPIDGPRNFEVFFSDGSSVEVKAKDEAEARSAAFGEAARLGEAVQDGPVEQTGFSITPALQASVEQGLPLFSLKRRVNDTLRKVDSAVDGLSNLPNQFDYLKDRYLALGKIARVDEISAEIRKSLNKASDADKKAIYAYLTTRGASTARISEPALRLVSKRIKDTIEYTGDQLVARGLLDQQSRDHYRDQYLPRMYLRHLLDDNSAKVIGMGKKPSDLGYLKHRKDIPVEIRELVLGEVKDPSFLSVNAIGRAMRDISLMDWMGKISLNNDWVFPEIFTQWNGHRVTAYWLRAEADRIERQAEHYDATNKPLALAKVTQMRALANQTLGNLQTVDHKKYKQIPDTTRYGLLRGMYVRTEIYNDIMGASQIVNADPTWFEDWFGFGGKGTRLTQWWKFTKVALNPPGQIRNFVSNMVMLQLSGVSLHKLPFRLIEAARDISSNGPYWKIAKKYGVTESTFTAQELFRVKRDLIDLEAKMGRVNPLRFVMAAGASFLEKVSDLYQFSEALGKTIKIIDEMKNGKSEAEAAIEAQKWLFDYSLVPQSVRIARNAPVGMPFLTYQIKVLPRLLEVAAKHPWRFLPWVGLLYGMQAVVASLFGVDDDELDKLKKSLPEWLQDRGHTVFLPVRDGEGRLQVADVGYFFPWTFYSQLGKHAAEGKVKKVLADDLGGMFSAPILGAGAALMSNYDSFTHKPIYNESDPVGYQAAAIANFAYDLMAPPFLSSHGVISPMGLADKKFGGKLVQALGDTTNRFGDPKASEEQAIGALVGFNFYGMDPEHTRISNMQVMNMKIRDAERALRTRLMDRGLSPEERTKVMRDYQEKMIELQKDMVEYAKESDVPQQLRVLKRQ